MATMTGGIAAYGDCAIFAAKGGYKIYSGIGQFTEYKESGAEFYGKPSVGRQVFAFAAGSQKLYDYIDHNPEVMGAPVDYTNDVHVISQIDNFISINNAIDCDLFGQVNAESAGIKHISGTGGQLDFALGAYQSKGGKSFICMSSTVAGKDGSLKSRIVPTLTQGSIATDPRTCVHYIVTEYGMVNVKGLSTWERAEQIINIAHPDFREQLIKDAEKMGIWRKSNK